VKAEATQKDLLVILEKSIIACRKIPTHICPKDSKKAEEIMHLIDFECYKKFTASSGNLGQSCPGMGRLLLELEIHKEFISGFITKLPLAQYAEARCYPKKRCLTKLFKFKKFSIKQAFFINDISSSQVKVHKQKKFEMFSS
jgi:hypothetical protein